MQSPKNKIKKPDIHIPLKAQIGKKPVKLDERYTSQYAVTGTIQSLSEAYDLLFRKWTVEEGPNDTYTMCKRKWGRSRPLSLKLYLALGQRRGIEAFDNQTSENKKRMIARQRLIERNADIINRSKPSGADNA